MKFIFLNLKRFDVPPEFGGVNRIAPMADWGAYIVKSTQEALKKYSPDEVEFVQFFPEAHILSAAGALCKDSPVKVGCQSVYRENTAVGGNFGAFTTNRPASAAKALGCGGTIIGHCEERRDKAGILAAADVTDPTAINLILNKEIKAATEQGLRVLYCIGETAEEQANWEDTLAMQLELGLDNVDRSMVAIAYEPIWAIGPGKTPPDREYIQKIAKFVKESTDGMPLVYGGGLKVDNAEMLASIPEVDGGLIALTRFSGEIGFYPDEYLEIIDTYMNGGK
ncbi:MAG: triose-phosphate isomerase family protein [Angelakisella sp.]